MSPHDVLRVPPPQLREHFLTALAALRVSHRGTRMFAYKQVVYDVVRLTFPTWNGPELLNLSNWLGEYQAGFVEHPSSAHDEHPDNIRVLQAVWQLITDGIVYPRLREIRDGQPDSIEWLVITDRGLRVLNDTDHPRRPGFAERFAKRHPTIAQEVIDRLDDAAACLERGVLRAAVVMVGLAFEETLRAACENIKVAGHVRATPQKAVEVMKALRDYVERLPQKMDKRHTLLMALVAAEGVRTERNGSGHPGARFDDEDSVEDLLVSASRQIPVVWKCLVDDPPPVPTS